MSKDQFFTNAPQNLLACDNPLNFKPPHGTRGVDRLDSPLLHFRFSFLLKLCGKDCFPHPKQFLLKMITNFQIDVWFLHASSSKKLFLQTWTLFFSSIVTDNFTLQIKKNGPKFMCDPSFKIFYCSCFFLFQVIFTEFNMSNDILTWITSIKNMSTGFFLCKEIYDIKYGSYYLLAKSERENHCFSFFVFVFVRSIFSGKCRW